MAKKLTPAKAKEILHDKSVHGHPLTDKQRKFFGAMSNMKKGGWLDNYGEEDNYNDSQASAPEGMIGDGFSNVGRNYSPAWGGQFQMGGYVYPVNYVPQAQEGLKVPSRKDYKTQGQYNAALKTHKLNLHKYELANNPEKIKGESDKDYENRTKYFDFKVRQEENKYPVSKAYLEMKDNQNADPNAVTRTLRQIATSPVHVAYGIYNAANPHDLDKYKSRATKNNEDLDLTNSALDVASLLVPFDYGMKASPLWKQAATRTVKEVAEDEGFNLLKAGNKWINSFQMGGTIAGAVGFTYARTAGSAPSNGPYAKKTKASAQNGKEMQYYQHGLDFQPKTISKNGSWLSKYEEGGEVIKDDRGQWDHPGEITEIGSNQITMQGVPYPVLGVSDTGDTQMMYPEEEYEFDGEKVTEYPMAKDGLRQEQKGLQNLDNLTNFTNYNKPQPGGWLNKYN